MTANRLVATGHIGPHSGSTPHMTVSREWWEGTAQSATYQARQAEERESEERLRAAEREPHLSSFATMSGARVVAVGHGGRIVIVDLDLAGLVELRDHLTEIVEYLTP